MKQYILSAFVSKRGGGNKAAVVYDDIGISDEKMKAIAAMNNLSETAFVKMNSVSDNEVIIRYFTPEEEVDICGHAALASFYILKQTGIVTGNNFKHITKAGKLDVRICDDISFIEMAKPNIVCEIELSDVLKFTNLKSEEIIVNNNSKISVISTGLKDIILEVKSLDILKNLVIYNSSMIEYCKRHGFVGMHVVSRETIEHDSDFACRNFAPAVGIDEESATGTSNASLIYYMLERYKSDIRKEAYKIEQGYFMNMPSNIFVNIREEENKKLFVGGKVKYIEEQQIVV